MSGRLKGSKIKWALSNAVTPPLIPELEVDSVVEKYHYMFITDLVGLSAFAVFYSTRSDVRNWCTFGLI